MPELPEVETVRRDLEPVVSGRIITDMSITERRIVRRVASSETIVTAARGGRIERLGRRGKFLLFELANKEERATGGGMALVIHLGMSGRLYYSGPASKSAASMETLDATLQEQLDDRHVHAVITLDDGGLLMLRDPRMFGEIFVTDDFESMIDLGPEPLAEEFTPELLGQRLHSRSPIKSALLDQRRVAGIGNIYADEALFAAKIHPLRKAGTLSGAELSVLHAAIQHVLELAIENRGSTIGDYRDAFGQAGAMQARHQVYGRTGPCLRCGAQLERIRVAGRGTFFCPRCQPPE